LRYWLVLADQMGLLKPLCKTQHQALIELKI
jgi:hypothetical protein